MTSRNLPDLTFSCTFLVVVPTLLYGIAYIANILKNGLVGPDGDSNDWYGFAIGGIKSIPAAFIIILAVTWGMALCFLRLRS